MLLCFPPLFFTPSFPGYVDLSDIVCSGQHIRAYDYILAFCKVPLYVLINKARLALGKNPNPVFSFSAALFFSSYTHLGFLPPNSCLHD
jgi:hypothetical protein